jgi:cardiolipin synthase
MLDGFFAKIMGKKTYLGAFLDPLADKVMLVSSFIALYLKGIMPLWVTCVVLLRDIVISSGFFVLYRLSYRVKPSPAILGKLATVAQIVTIIYILWSHVRTYEEFFFYGATFFTVVSGFQYILRGVRILLEKDVV